MKCESASARIRWRISLLKDCALHAASRRVIPSTAPLAIPGSIRPIMWIFSRFARRLHWQSKTVPRIVPSKEGPWIAVAFFFAHHFSFYLRGAKLCGRSRVCEVGFLPMPSEDAQKTCQYLAPGFVQREWGDDCHVSQKLGQTKVAAA